MTLPVVVRILAERKIDKVVIWHERKRAGLGLRLRQRIDETLLVIEGNPYLHAPHFMECVTRKRRSSSTLSIIAFVRHTLK